MVYRMRVLRGLNAKDFCNGVFSQIRAWPQRQGRASTQVSEGGADFYALTLQQLEAFSEQPGRMPDLVCKREARFRTVS